MINDVPSILTEVVHDLDCGPNMYVKEEVTFLLLPVCSIGSTVAMFLV